MSSSHNDDQHSNEQKPVAFTVPLIMASALIFIIVMFLSLCDPKQHHAGEAGHDDQSAAMESTHHDAAASEEHAATHEKNVVEKDTVSAETAVPSAEPAHH